MGEVGAQVTVETRFAGPQSKIHIRVEKNTDAPGVAKFHLDGHGYRTTAEATYSSHNAGVDLEIPGATVWSPETPNLYDLVVDLEQGGEVVDSYSMKIGIRTIRVEGDQLLLNERPVYLKGFGRHEDFPVVGRGYLPALIVKDYALMKWMGANSSPDHALSIF